MTKDRDRPALVAECDQGPRCDTCGAPLVSGAQATMCPRGRGCEFWDMEHDAFLVFLRGSDPDDDGFAAARGGAP